MNQSTSKQTNFGDKVKNGLLVASDSLFELILPKVFLGLIVVSFFYFLIINIPFFDVESMAKLSEFEEELSSILFNENKSSLLINISVVLIGFFITVMSVLGTNYSKAVSKLVEDNVSDRFISYSAWALTYAFTFLILSILNTDFSEEGVTLIYSFLFCALLANAIRFTLIVIEIFRKNISGSCDEVREQDQKEKELIGLLREIKEHLEYQGEDEEKYKEELRRKITEQEKKEGMDNNE
ncbi:hypothetical protein [Halobacillus sp. B29]|uniref:hypothetical protein n=1 Tax=Halobacillus sp. B29 TaxID=3457432 RepID=UPI003FCD801B